ncbi:MAG: PEP-CTERM sorting domain-containing protein [Candidatus Zixiibacteriota bacterium]
MMKSPLKIGMILTILLMTAMPLWANVYTVVPTPSANLWNLGHDYYYTWGLTWDMDKPATSIYDIKLTFHNVWDWIDEDDDFLYTHLLDYAPQDAVIGYDGAENGDYFESANYTGNEKLIGVWSDPYGGAPRDFDLTYSLRDLGLMNDVHTYINNDGVFGFGFDADCHYNNEGISLEITTVPEPATLLLFGLGLVGVRAYSRRKK